MPTSRVGVMRYNGLIVIPGISWALGPVAVSTVFAAVKQCNESMGKAQRRAYHHGAMRASHQQPELRSRDLQHPCLHTTEQLPSAY